MQLQFIVMVALHWFSAEAGRQWRVRIAHRIASDSADVVGRVYVFGEMPDDTVGL